MRSNFISTCSCHLPVAAVDGSAGRSAWLFAAYFLKRSLLETYAQATMNIETASQTTNMPAKSLNVIWGTP